MASITNDVIDVLVKTGLLESNGSGGVIPGLRKVTDASGNTVLVGPDGVIPRALGSNVITVGDGGDFTDIADAIDYRNTVHQHTLAHTTTCTITGSSSGTVDVRTITLASAFSAYAATRTASYGVQINNAGPIIPVRLYSDTLVLLPYPITQDFAAGTPIKIYELKRASIFVLPGNQLILSAHDDMTFPAYTTLAGIPGTSEIIKRSSSVGSLFVTDDTFNQSRITGLRLVDDYHGINSIFFNMNKGAGNNSLVPMADFEFDNNDVVTTSNDVLYCITPGGIGLNVHDNKMKGTFDVLRFSTHRKVLVYDNDIDIEASSFLDNDNPAGVVLGATSAWDYAWQTYEVRNNHIKCVDFPTQYASSKASATGVDIRNPISSAADVIVVGNTIDVEVVAGTGAGWTIGTESATGIKVGPLATGTNTPTIVVKDNNVRAAVSGGNTTTPTIAKSSNANYVIKTAGNSVFGGGATALGANTAALTTY